MHLTYHEGNRLSGLTPTQSFRDYNCNGTSVFAKWISGKAVPWNEVLVGDAGDLAYPGGSKVRVNRAGVSIRKRDASEHDYEIVDIWRAAHRPVLNTFQSILRNRTKGTQIVVAQRHKRRSTIFGKLDRFESMQLARMDDVAGCRLIFPTLDELYKFRKTLHGAHFSHLLKNDPDKYDYIKKPKNTGYRGVHDVYAYDVNSEHGKPYKGLLIELQFRTFYQHAWATAVEVVGFITESQPKFQQGDKRYEHALALASEIIARTCENSTSCHHNLTDAELVTQFLSAEGDIGLMRMLRALNSANSEVTDKKNIILIFTDAGTAKPQDLETISFRDATDALRALFQLEKDNPQKDIVLVRANTSEDVRVAFRNYFSDAREFISLIDNGCQILAKDKVFHGPKLQRVRRPKA